MTSLRDVLNDGRPRPLELHIRPHGDVLITSGEDVFKASVGNVHWGVTYRTIWGRSQDAIFQRPKDVGRGPSQDVSRGRSLALHRGPYGDVHRTSFRDVVRTSSGRNFAE